MYSKRMEKAKPELHDAQAFKKALAHYKVSDHARQILDGMQLVAMSGLAGGGRNTIINRLVEQYDYFFIVSDTTRPPKVRSGVLEQEGAHYYFREEKDMLRDVQKGEFLEAEVIHNQQVSGTSIRELLRAKKSGRIAIHDYEYGGIQNLVLAKPDACIIGLLPPSYTEWIRRFRDREVITEQEFINRMQTAEKVLENILEKPYFKVVINDDLDTCVEAIRAIVERNEYSNADAAIGKRIATEILKRVREVLQNGV
jgi:guanylate kinase